MAPELAGLGKGVIRSLVSFSSLPFPRLGCEVMLTGIVSQRACEERLFSLPYLHPWETENKKRRPPCFLKWERRNWERSLQETNQRKLS